MAARNRFGPARGAANGIGFCDSISLGDRGDGITDPGDDPVQIVARNAKPPFQDSNLTGVSHINFIASGRGFKATHVSSSVMTNQIA
jgi:hypothetical protein